ncbi:hypothetical protein SAMN05216189_103523 [Pseudomonas delhiensis]|uniref:Uncharacterized protein n=1 Tax=Pseudomonas delhiensis TaxID=366289 RepID=A0A239MVX4_9PSED|nr:MULTISPECIES: hypothetical protein [Pseudomonas]MED5608276.1 hypothetical protein [Pseudomonas sp. JH-2]PWU29741.1 hypothetical protein DK254_16745 [Pseudomonas sp. RW407]SDK33130.1 hypothetical protein SAMN05216189_103523 [Pseudomonas delhiensis]SNT46264.1 hypothetical protein SAMN06295949_13126 [Pseudomonas delhiensis]
MSTLTIEGWCKTNPDAQPMPIEDIHFYLSGTDRRHLEDAEEELQRTHEPERWVDVDMSTLELNLPEEYSPLSDCRMRVYLDRDERGHFHLVGHRASDGSLIYSNAVLIDQLL